MCPYEVDVPSWILVALVQWDTPEDMSRYAVNPLPGHSFSPPLSCAR